MRVFHVKQYALHHCVALKSDDAGSTPHVFFLIIKKKGRRPVDVLTQKVLAGSVCRCVLPCF